MPTGRAVPANTPAERAAARIRSLAAAHRRRDTTGLSRLDFATDDKTLDAVVRNLEVIGEAVKQLPVELRAREPNTDWQKIAGLRDILIHQYFGIDADILWDIIQHKLPALDASVHRLLRT